jgi:hypothetical protein
MYSFRSFSIRLFIFSIFTLGLLFLWQQFVSDRFRNTLWLPLWLFFILSTALIHYSLLKTSEKDPKRFVGAFMGFTAIKLFGYLILIVAYALVKREAALGFTLQFLVLYLLYSAFEVVMLLKHFKR